MENIPLKKEHLLRYFRDGEKPGSKLIGIEAEKIGVIQNNGETGSYSGKNGYLAILGKMYEELGWKISQQEKQFILQLTRGKTTLNLETDGRIELSGAPKESLHDVVREFRIHQHEISEISSLFGIGWLGIGYQPISKASDIQEIPQTRLQKVLKFFQERAKVTGNEMGIAWYKKTAEIHVNIDYASENDFARKSKVLFKIAPILTAMFANSPFSRGKFTGYMSFRSHITKNAKVRRFLTPKALYESKFTYSDWLDHILSLDFLFLNRGEEFIAVNIPFGEFLEKGFQGNVATMEDFHIHMKSVWMDVRMRNIIELRSVDSLPPALVPAVAALVKGLMYSEDSLSALEKLTEDWSFFEYAELQEDVEKYALYAQIRGVKVLDFAKEFLRVAEKNLKTERILDFYGEDESKFLEPIKEFIFVREKSPAKWLVEKWDREWHQNFLPVLQWCQY